MKITDTFYSLRYKFPVLYINQFYPRPGTPAAKMKRVPTQDVKQRTKQLTELFHSYEPYRKRVGQKYQVLVTELAHDKQHYVGHNEFYEQVCDIISLYAVILIGILIYGFQYFAVVLKRLKTQLWK